MHAPQAACILNQAHPRQSLVRACVSACVLVRTLFCRDKDRRREGACAKIDCHEAASTHTSSACQGDGRNGKAPLAVSCMAQRHYLWPLVAASATTTPLLLLTQTLGPMWLSKKQADPVQDARCRTCRAHARTRGRPQQHAACARHGGGGDDGGDGDAHAAGRGVETLIPHTYTPATGAGKWGTSSLCQHARPCLASTQYTQPLWQPTMMRIVSSRATGDITSAADIRGPRAAKLHTSSPVWACTDRRRAPAQGINTVDSAGHTEAGAKTGEPTLRDQTTRAVRPGLGSCPAATSWCSRCGDQWGQQGNCRHTTRPAVEPTTTQEEASASCPP